MPSKIDSINTGRIWTLKGQRPSQPIMIQVSIFGELGLPASEDSILLVISLKC
jgi:hypothetical protein